MKILAILNLLILESLNISKSLPLNFLDKWKFLFNYLTFFEYSFLPIMFVRIGINVDLYLLHDLGYYYWV